MTYWERQERQDSCRMHAVNACLGRRAFVWQTFLEMCDQFDALAGLQNTARAHYCAGNGITLFAHALKTAGVNWTTLPLAMYRAGSTDDKKTPARLEMAKTTASGAFVYNAGHVWYVKRVDGNKWMKLDSLSGVTGTTLDAIWHDGLGVELIFESEHFLPTAGIKVLPSSPSLTFGIEVHPAIHSRGLAFRPARRPPNKSAFLGFSKRR